MSSSRDERLAQALRELRPTPRPVFAAELDARAAAGFPRRRGTSPLARLIAVVRAIPPRRALLPVAGVGVAAVLLATAVLATFEGSKSGAGSPAAQRGLSSSGQHLPAPAPRAGSAASGTTGHGEAGETELEASAPSAATARRAGPYASQQQTRDIERSASIVLADGPSRVRSDTAQVFEAVQSAEGIVLHSTIRDGTAGEAGANFQLLIPTGRLGEAMAAFSAIAEVRSRHDSTADITAPTLSARERLQDSAARVQSLLAQLAAAETESQRAAVEVELQAERRRLAALRSQVSGLQRRANLSHVALRIETAAASGQGGGGWGLGNGFDDAGRILAIAAGVSVIGLAALAPLALLALLGWLVRRAWLDRARRAALLRTDV